MDFWVNEWAPGIIRVMSFGKGKWDSLKNDDDNCHFYFLILKFFSSGAEILIKSFRGI